MKGLIRGVAGAALVLGATACADDYSIDFGGAPTAVQPSPEVMFLASGAQKEILVRLVNDRNQSTPASFNLANVGAGLTITYDDQYRPRWTSKDTALVAPLVKEQQRYIVSANIPTGGQRTFQFTSGGLSGTVQVNVTPTVIGLAGGPGGLLEEVTITAPGFILRPNFGIFWGDTAAQVVSVAEDGSSAQVILPANQTGTPTIRNVAVSFLPTVTLASIANVEAVNTAVTPYNGSQPNTSTAILNAPGTLRDTWSNYGDDLVGNGGANKWYRIVIPTAGTYTVSLDWNAETDGTFGDYDFYFRNTTNTGNLLTRFTTSRPESGPVTLAAGTYWLAVSLYQDIHPAGVLTISVQ